MVADNRDHVWFGRATPQSSLIGRSGSHGNCDLVKAGFADISLA